tara:strand:+ start:1523 stop:3136 length:1614 start_codon:yes stop_codon:yes gene_type:complete
MVWAATAIVGSAVIGGVASSNAAGKASDAQDRASQLNYEASMAGFNLSKPYLSDLYKSQQSQYDQMLENGAYSGQTFAGMDPRTTTGYDQMYGQGSQQNLAATGMMDTTSGFAGNAANLYNTAANSNVQGDAMNFAGQNGIGGALDFANANNSAQSAINFGNANNNFANSYDYASNNTGVQDANAFAAGSTNVQDANAFAAGSTNVQDSLDFAAKDDMQGAIDYASGDRLDSLTKAAMRDPYRQLTESTLTGIDASASASGNMNSSRAGIADALAQRSYDDRSADVSAGIQDSLMTQYTNNRDTLANNYLGDRSDQTDRFSDNRNTQADTYLGNRNDIASDYRNAGDAASDRFTNSSDYLSDSYLTNQSDQRNFYGNTENTQYSNMTTANNNMGNIYGNALASQGASTQGMINAGNAFGANAQAQLNDERANYDAQNGYAFGVTGQYSNMLNGLAVSNSTNPNIQANMYDPTAAGITGAMSGGMGAYQFAKDNNLFGNNTNTVQATQYSAAPSYGQTDVFSGATMSPTSSGGGGFFG